MRTIKKPKTMGKATKVAQHDTKFENWARNRMKKDNDSSKQYYKVLYNWYLENGPKGTPPPF